MKNFFKALYFIACVFLLKIGNDLFFLTDVNLFWVCLYVFFCNCGIFPTDEFRVAIYTFKKVW